MYVVYFIEKTRENKAKKNNVKHVLCEDGDCDMYHWFMSHYCSTVVPIWLPITSFFTHEESTTRFSSTQHYKQHVIYTRHFVTTV